MISKRQHRGRAILTKRNDNPKGIAKDEIPPEEGSFRSRIRQIENVMVKHARRIVQHIAIKLTKGYESLQWVSQGMLGHDHACQNEGKWAPEKGRDRFHAQHEGVLGLIPRVRQRVLFPELAKEILHCGHAAEIVCEIAFEEKVDAAACFEGEWWPASRWDWDHLHRTNHMIVHRSPDGIFG